MSPVTLTTDVSEAYTLLGVRKKLVKLSGNYGLVVDAANEDWTDNGANDFLNAGQKWLDQRFEYDKQQAWYTQVLTAGTSLVTFNVARYIESVEISSTSLERKLLVRQTMNQLRELYPDVPLSAIDNAEPEHWTPSILGLAPQQYNQTESTLTTGGVTDLDFYEYGNYYLTSGVIILPPPDAAYTVKILARWFSKELTADADVSVWTMNRPELLVRAARLQMEVDLHRASEASNIFVASLVDDLDKLYQDFKAEQMAGPPADWIMNG